MKIADPCAHCGKQSLRRISTPMKVGLVGAVSIKPVHCDACQREYDQNNPHAELGKVYGSSARKLNLFGAVGILVVVALVVGYILWAID